MSELAATCGLLCSACSVYIATKEDSVRLKRISQRFGIPEEEVRCFGCGSGKRFGPCSVCSFSPCAKGKGLAFCSECESFPCKELKDFQAALPHRLDLWEDLEQAKHMKDAEWVAKVQQKYTCSRCGTINSAYDLSCRKCGQIPSCDFVERHMEALKKHLGVE
jgi:ribosomal protein L40E